MTINRISLVLLVLTVAFQGILLYRDYVVHPQGSQHREVVWDAPKGSLLDLSGVPIRGSNTAPIVMVEFSDYECPFCARHAVGVGKQVEEEFVSSGKVRQAFMNNPLPIHPNAQLLATAAICGGQQGRYWDMYDLLFGNRPKTKDDIMAGATKVSLNIAEFAQCIDGNREPAAMIERDLKRIETFRLDSTPMFAIGVLNENNVVGIQKFIKGAQPLDVFRKAINDVALKSKS